MVAQGKPGPVGTLGGGGRGGGAEALRFSLKFKFKCEGLHGLEGSEGSEGLEGLEGLGFRRVFANLKLGAACVPFRKNRWSA